MASDEGTKGDIGLTKRSAGLSASHDDRTNDNAVSPITRSTQHTMVNTVPISIGPGSSHDDTTTDKAVSPITRSTQHTMVNKVPISIGPGSSQDDSTTDNVMSHTIQSTTAQRTEHKRLSRIYSKKNILETFGVTSEGLSQWQDGVKNIEALQESNSGQFNLLPSLVDVSDGGINKPTITRQSTLLQRPEIEVNASQLSTGSTLKQQVRHNNTDLKPQMIRNTQVPTHPPPRLNHRKGVKKRSIFQISAKMTVQNGKINHTGSTKGQSSLSPTSTTGAAIPTTPAAKYGTRMADHLKTAAAKADKFLRYGAINEHRAVHAGSIILEKYSFV